MHIFDWYISRFGLPKHKDARKKDAYTKMSFILESINDRFFFLKVMIISLIS
jgi:hypothetical protein